MSRTDRKRNKQIQFRKDGIYDQDGDGHVTRIAPPILVTAYATSNPNTPRESALQ
jgi:hypothetical protein